MRSCFTISMFIWTRYETLRLTDLHTPIFSGSSMGVLHPVRTRKKEKLTTSTFISKSDTIGLLTLNRLGIVRSILLCYILGCVLDLDTLTKTIITSSTFFSRSWKNCNRMLLTIWFTVWFLPLWPGPGVWATLLALPSWIPANPPPGKVDDLEKRLMQSIIWFFEIRCYKFLNSKITWLREIENFNSSVWEMHSTYWINRHI